MRATGGDCTTRKSDSITVRVALLPRFPLPVVEQGYFLFIRNLITLTWGFATEDPVPANVSRLRLHSKSQALTANRAQPAHLYCLVENSTVVQTSGYVWEEYLAVHTLAPCAVIPA